LLCIFLKRILLRNSLIKTSKSDEKLNCHVVSRNIVIFAPSRPLVWKQMGLQLPKSKPTFIRCQGLLCSKFKKDLSCKTSAIVRKPYAFCQQTDDDKGIDSTSHDMNAIFSLVVYKGYFQHHIGGSMSYVVTLPNNSYKPDTNTAWVCDGFVNYKKRCTRLAVASDQVYQLLAHGRWFSPLLRLPSPLKLVAMI
jgi:hypothetical protein